MWTISLSLWMKMVTWSVDQLCECECWMLIRSVHNCVWMWMLITVCECEWKCNLLFVEIWKWSVSALGGFLEVFFCLSGCRPARHGENGRAQRAARHGQTAHGPCLGPKARHEHGAGTTRQARRPVEARHRSGPARPDGHVYLGRANILLLQIIKRLPSQ